MREPEQDKSIGGDIDEPAKSKAPYIVADLFIEKLVSMASDEGTIPLPHVHVPIKGK